MAIKIKKPRPNHLSAPVVNQEYFPYDKELIINDDDPDLLPITIPLPAPPPLKFIDGYGLPREKQFFYRPLMPTKLAKLVKDSESIEKVWDTLGAKQAEFQDELFWIKKQWYYRIHGYWFMCNGKPTWITGGHYFYLTACKIDSGWPNYRARSRAYFITIDYFLNYHYDFKEKTFDAKGNRLANKPGDELVDIGRRNVFGVIQPKQRRVGSTYESLGFMLHMTLMSMNAHSGLQSIDHSHAKRTFTSKVVSMFRKIPFYFMPSFDGSVDPQNVLRFVKKSDKNIADAGLESKITYAASSSSYFYDQEKLLIYIRDECGKVVGESIYEGWEIVKQTLAQGSGMNIVGFALYPSTAGEFTAEGGEAFYYLIKDSNYYERTANGQTKSGMVTIFWGAYHGLEGYIDRFGNSVIENPTPEQKKELGITVGAREYLLKDREHYLKLGTPEAIQQYRSRQRLFPLYLKECFVSDSTTIGFNEIIMDKRISELMFKNPCVTGNFEWRGGRRDGIVDFIENPNGRFIVSWMPEPGKRNLKHFRDGQWYPADSWVVMHGSDTFSYDKVEGNRLSNGALVGVRRRDYTVDPEDKPISEWLTPSVCYTYSYRANTTDEYCEDALMVNVFYGGMMNPESNVPNVRHYYTRRGYGGYLHYFKDDNGKYRNTAGYILRTNADKLLSLGANHIEWHGHRMNHVELLRDCKALRGKADITNHDLTAAYCGALFGIDDSPIDTRSVNQAGYDLSGWINIRRY